MNTLDDWTRTVATELGLDTGYERDLILELTRTVAHEVARPAAPLTAFLVGLAAGQRGGSPDAVREVAGRVEALAREYEHGNSSE